MSRGTVVFAAALLALVIVHPSIAASQGQGRSRDDGKTQAQPSGQAREKGPTEDRSEPTAREKSKDKSEDKSRTAGKDDPVDGRGGKDANGRGDVVSDCSHAANERKLKGKDRHEFIERCASGAGTGQDRPEPRTDSKAGGQQGGGDREDKSRAKGDRKRGSED